MLHSLLANIPDEFWKSLWGFLGAGLLAGTAALYKYYQRITDRRQVSSEQLRREKHALQVENYVLRNAYEKSRTALARISSDVQIARSLQARGVSWEEFLTRVSSQFGAHGEVLDYRAHAEDELAHAERVQRQVEEPEGG